MSILERIVELYAPHECLGCGREGATLCTSCRSGVVSSVKRCYRCHRADAESRTCANCRRHGGLLRVQAACRYEGTAKDALWRLKFGRAKAASRDIAALIVPALSECKKAEAIVVHIPTATSRVRQRGYDQAALIARSAAQTAGLRHAPLLLRRGQQRQVGLRRQQRLSQLDGAFQVRNPDTAKGAYVILVDDVVTTGATLEAAAKTLKKAGARHVEAVVVAQA